MPHSCSAVFMVGLDNTAVNVAVPSIGRQLHASVAGEQWAIAAYTIVLASLMLLAGAMGDRIGRRTVFQVGLATFILGSEPGSRNGSGAPATATGTG